MLNMQTGEAASNRFSKLMRRSHVLRIRVQLMDLNGNHQKDLSKNFLSGQVTVDTTQEITRALDLSLIDPLNRVNLEPDSASPTSVFIADMIRIIYVVRDPESDEVHQVPVFTGPIDAVSRSGMFIDIKAVGKEKLGLNNTWNGRTFKKGQRKTEVIKQILQDFLGERAARISVPTRQNRLPSDLKLSHEDIPWKVASRLASSMNMVLFYDGRGVARMKPRTKKPVFQLDETWAYNEPDVAYDLSEIVNAVRVIGSKPKKAKEKVRYSAVAQASHPLSPWRLGRGGVPRYISQVIEDDGLRTVKECRELAEDILQSGLLAGVSFTCDGMIDPRLEELDAVRVSVGDVNVQAPVKSFVIPLTAGDPASYGYIKKIVPKGGAKGVKRHKSKNKKGKKGKDVRKGTSTADGKKK